LEDSTVLRASRAQWKFCGQKSDPNMQFGCIAQKLMHYSGLNLDEKDAYVRALIHIAGVKGVCFPWKMDKQA
jgi:hypothetical protein